MSEQVGPDFLPERIRQARANADNFRWALEHHAEELSERQTDVVRRWVGLDGPPVDASVLAAEYGVSASMIHKLFQRACQRLRRAVQDASAPPLPTLPPPPKRYSANGRASYLTDLSDEEWERIAPLLPDVKAERGRHRSADYREIVNALRYKQRTKVPWLLLPHDLPPATVVRYYYRRWREDGTLEQVEERLTS